MALAQYDEDLTTLETGLRQRASLHDGRSIPWLGLGVYQMGNDAETERAVRTAIDLGYRHIDTASLYGNERGVGVAVKGSSVPREELFVTTKIWNDDLREERVRDAFEESMARLDLEYLDLLLIHWPVEGKFVGAWETLADLHSSGRVRSVGVSNFMPEHLDELRRRTDLVPVMNQVEFHPYLRSPALLSYCADQHIRLTAWSPLMQGGVLGDPILRQVGAEHGKSAAQVVLRWDLQSGVVTIPKSSHEERMRENADIFDFSLSPEEMEAINALDRGQRHGADPRDFDF